MRHSETVSRNKQENELQRKHRKLITESASPYFRDRYLAIHTIVLRQKDQNGVGYYHVSNTSHFGRVQFYLHDDSAVTLLSRDSLPLLQYEVKAFLEKNGFSITAINKANKRVERAWHILSSDRF
jgi:hypothetical protein